MRKRTRRDEKEIEDALARARYMDDGSQWTKEDAVADQGADHEAVFLRWEPSCDVHLARSYRCPACSPLVRPKHN